MENLFKISSSRKEEYKKIIAIALKYKRESKSAPQLTAKGEGDIAQKIIELASKSGVKIVKDAKLVEILKPLEIDDCIPYEAYGAVSAILAHIYKKNASLR